MSIANCEATSKTHRGKPSRESEELTPRQLNSHTYVWPPRDWDDSSDWTLEPTGQFRVRAMPESLEALHHDSRWPAFFPSSMCLVTASDGRQCALEKVVGASIVNRFPYIVALSFCRESLSHRHHPRSHFMQLLERGGRVAVQFLVPGASLDQALHVVTTTNDDMTGYRVAATKMRTRAGCTNESPVFEDAYLIYEARLVRPGNDLEGTPIHGCPWVDVGSHRIYFLEINAIQLREDIARGESQIRWRSLPTWRSSGDRPRPAAHDGQIRKNLGYQKGFTADYAFPSSQTVGFEADEFRGGYAIKHLPTSPTTQVERDNDRARWPCFFPSSVGMITSQDVDGAPNLMPCGSTTVVSRHPMIIAPCVSYAAINQRYAPRASLEIIRRTRKFGCGVPYLSDSVLDAIRYAGNVSLANDVNKVANCGLGIDQSDGSPRLLELPIHYDCELVGEIKLGTHMMLLGEVKRISVRADVSRDHPLRWMPWAEVSKTVVAEKCA